jgi:hypothetical protein
LTGGYYDAGDNVKFGFPLAFSSTMLAWSVLEFGGMMKGELQHARDAVRWGSDYLLKATAHPDTVYVQVPEPPPFSCVGSVCVSTIYSSQAFSVIHPQSTNITQMSFSSLLRTKSL